MEVVHSVCVCDLGPMLAIEFYFWSVVFSHMSTLKTPRLLSQ